MLNTFREALSATAAFIDRYTVPVLAVPAAASGILNAYDALPKTPTSFLVQGALLGAFALASFKAAREDTAEVALAPDASSQAFATIAKHLSARQPV